MIDMYFCLVVRDSARIVIFDSIYVFKELLFSALVSSLFGITMAFLCRN